MTCSHSTKGFHAEIVEVGFMIPAKRASVEHILRDFKIYVVNISLYTSIIVRNCLATGLLL